MSYLSFWKLKMELVNDAELLKQYPFHQKRGFVKVGKKKWLLPYKYVEEGDNIYNFETRPDDVWIITYPGSDITMLQELVWLVANMNFDAAHQISLTPRLPFIEIGAILDDDIATKDVSSRINTEKYSVEFVNLQLSPRFLKSHMPFDLLPTVLNSTCKIIYVARNPRDVVVSWYNFLKSLNQYQGTFEQFYINFMNNHTLWSPYWEHVKEALTVLKKRPNMMFLFYEDLIKDLSGNIKKIAEFFGKNYSDEQIVKLMHMRIEIFRKKPIVNQSRSDIVMPPEMFIQQETTDDWKKMFTPEIEERFNKWINDNLKN